MIQLKKASTTAAALSGLVLSWALVSGCAETTSTPFNTTADIVDGLAHPVLESDGEPQQLRDVLQSEKPIVIDFTATWCGPCQMLKPELRKLAEKYRDKVTVVKVDVDECAALAEQFRVGKRMTQKAVLPIHLRNLFQLLKRA